MEVKATLNCLMEHSFRKLTQEKTWSASIPILLPGGFCIIKMIKKLIALTLSCQWWINRPPCFQTIMSCTNIKRHPKVSIFSTENQGGLWWLNHTNLTSKLLFIFSACKYKIHFHFGYLMTTGMNGLSFLSWIIIELSFVPLICYWEASGKPECIKCTDRRTDWRTDGDPRSALLGLLSEPKIQEKNGLLWGV